MDTHSDTIKIMSLFLLFVALGAAAACLCIHWHVFQGNKLALALLIGSLACTIVSGTAMILSAAHGLGRTVSPTDPQNNLSTLQKTLYISEIFHVLSIGLEKLCSVVLFQIILSGGYRTKMVIFLKPLCGCLILWTITMVIAVSLQCHPPRVWNIVSGTCRNLTAMWTYFSASNIAIDTLLIILPSLIVIQLQMKLRNRLIVIGCFGIKVLSIIASTFQLHYAQRFDAPQYQLPQELWPWAICGQVLQSTALACTCIPYLREFVKALPRGGLKLPMSGSEED